MVLQKRKIFIVVKFVRILFLYIYEEPKVREHLYFSRNLLLHFRRNGRFSESRDSIILSMPDRCCAGQVSCRCFPMWRSHPILTWTPYLLCVLGKIKYMGSCVTYKYLILFMINGSGSDSIVLKFYRRKTSKD